MRGRTERQGPTRKTEGASQKGRKGTDKHSALDLIRALRWRRWSPSEAAALARRRDHLELRRRHLDAVVRLYGRDREACRWHAERMAEIHRRGARHG